MKEFHYLNAASNTSRMRRILSHLLDTQANQALHDEHLRNVVQLYELGVAFQRFADSLPISEWRHRVSRYYYSCYNIQRSIRLHCEGVYSRDSSDHKKIGDFPADFPRRDFYATRFRDLREDRNMCDYDHSAEEADLINPVDTLSDMVSEFIGDSKLYLSARSVPL